MLIKMMKAKIHRATVTRADLNYEGSIGIDECLMQAAGFLPGEAVMSGMLTAASVWRRTHCLLPEDPARSA